MSIIHSIYSNIATFFFDLKKRLSMNKYYRTRIDPWSRSDSLLEIKAAISLIDDRNYDNCLDIGTGLGYFAEEAGKYCKNCLAIDISKEAIKKAQKRILNSFIEFKVSNIRTFEPKKTFDLIICGDVLYYLGDTLLSHEFSKLINKISSWINKGGKLLITHGALPSRNEEWFWSKYIKQFEQSGLVLEKKETFKQGDIVWLHVLLSKL